MDALYPSRKRSTWNRFKHWCSDALGLIIIVLGCTVIGAVIILAFTWALAIMSLFVIWFFINQYFGNGCKVTIDGKPAGRMRRFKIEKE